MDATGVSHIAICVRDLDKSLAFCRDILNQYQGGMCIAGVLTTTERTPRHFILPLGPN